MDINNQEEMRQVVRDSLLKCAAEEGTTLTEDELEALTRVTLDKLVASVTNFVYPGPRAPRFELINEAAGKSWAEIDSRNQDVYGVRIVDFANDWAFAIEEALAIGKNWRFEDYVVGALINRARKIGLTDHMLRMAVQTLALTWVHGMRLLEWYQRRDPGLDS